MFINRALSIDLNDSIALTSQTSDNVTFSSILVISLITALIVVVVLAFQVFHGKRKESPANVIRERTFPEPNLGTDPYRSSEKNRKFISPLDLNNTPERTSSKREPKTNFGTKESNSYFKAPGSVSDKNSIGGGGTEPAPKTTLPSTKAKDKPETSTPEKLVSVLDDTIHLQTDRIGYIPPSAFEQQDSLVYPYVAFPKPNSLIKLPQYGKTGRKGHTEEIFRYYLKKHFSDNFKIHDDHFFIVRNKRKPYEPDFSLIDDISGRNILLDIEIDEPYEGINEPKKRKPTHYLGSNSERDNAFTKRGWIVIRFAEIQIHRDPLACCQFIAELVKSIHPQYTIPKTLKTANKIQPVKQWTKEEASVWSIEGFREKYLGITSFGFSAENAPNAILLKSDDGSIIEDLIEEESLTKYLGQYESATAFGFVREVISDAIYREIFLSFTYDGSTRIVKPLLANETELRAYCFIKNNEEVFLMNKISEISGQENYHSEQFIRPDLQMIKNIFNNALELKQLLRISYFQKEMLDRETGELIEEVKHFTISEMKPVQEGTRTFKGQTYQANRQIHFDAKIYANASPITLRFDRIRKIEILYWEN